MKILIWTDESEQARDALRFTGTIVAATDARITLLGITEKKQNQEGYPGVSCRNNSTGEPESISRLFRFVRPNQNLHCVSLELSSSKQSVNDQARTDERQRHKGQPNPRSHKMLGQGRPNLRADCGARMHDQSDHDIHVALEGMAQRSIAGGDHNFKKVCADSDVRGDTKYVNQRRHANVSRAASEESTEDSSNKSH